jgi:hypothetical protein
MVQLLVTLGFAAILIGAARMIWAELARPLHLYPACEDDVRLDAMLAARAVRPAPRTRPVAISPQRQARRLPSLAAAA